MSTYTGNEPFLINEKATNLTITDYWRWAYSDLINNIDHHALAEFIVASSIGLLRTDTETFRNVLKPYDLLSMEGFRITVKSAAYVRSRDSKHPDHISFGIAPARIPVETGDHKMDAPIQRNSDVYVFCIYTSMSKDETPLSLDLWEFYVLATAVLNEKKPTHKTITLSSLMQLNPIQCSYHEIGGAIQTAMSAR